MKDTKFWSRKIMLPLGFEVLGANFGNNSCYYKYVTFFPEKLAMLFFSAFKNRMLLYTFKSKKEYNEFRAGKFAITEDQNKDGDTGIVGNHLNISTPLILTTELIATP